MPSLKHSVLFDKIRERLFQNLPFALFRAPESQTIHAIYQEDQELTVLQDYRQSGFLFAPFDMQDNIVLLRADQIEAYPWEKSEFRNADNEQLVSDGRTTHIELLKKGIKAIEDGDLKKVVLSRKITTSYRKAPLNIFETILSRYDQAMVYFFHHPKVGTWLGATPERFLEIGKGRLSTTSLAGTLPVEGGVAPMWTSKELKEQQIVTDFIKKELGSYVDNLECSETKTVRSGKLWHLKTEISAMGIPLQDWDAIIKALHPTPAVCGLPKYEALAFIQENESYSRKYYTGFLGGLNLDQKEQLQLYVNLRCMQMEKEAVHIFVGGGVTKDSDPEQEWLETQYKSRTMLDVL